MTVAATAPWPDEPLNPALVKAALSLGLCERITEFTGVSDRIGQAVGGFDLVLGVTAASDWIETIGGDRDLVEGIGVRDRWFETVMTTWTNDSLSERIKSMLDPSAFSVDERDFILDALINAGPGPTDAVQTANQAATTEQFGRALLVLRTEKGLSLNDIVRRLDENRAWIAKSTISRACSGRTLFRDRSQVVAYVTACGAKDETAQWVRAWERVRENRPPRTSRPDHALTIIASDEPVGGEVPGDELAVIEAAGDGPDDGPDDEVVGEIRVQVTRGHVRTAITVLAVTGLLAGVRGNSPTIKAVGTAALAVAGGLALLERGQSLARTHTQLDSPSTDAA